MKNVVLIGASGFVGNAILNELLERGHRVTAVVRNTSKITAKSENLEVKEIDVENAPAIIEAMKGKDDAHWVPLNNNNNLQLSCYDCRFLGFPRKTDITIADFWGIGKNYPFGHIGEIEKGVSLLIGNSEKGISLIRRSEDKMMCFERTLDEAIEKNQAGVHSCARPASRENFYHDLSHISFNEMLAKYMNPTVKIRLVKFFREYLPFSLIKYIRTRGQK